jgi:hypothetical protein
MSLPKSAVKVHVVPRNRRWEVSADGLTRRYIDWLCTKERAVEHAIERGHELAGAESSRRIVVVIERTDGSVEDALTLVH